MRNKQQISFVIPVFNEGPVIPLLLERLNPLLDDLDHSTEVIIVDDGSTDDSFFQFSRICESDPRFKVIRFSRNFGHQRAITAGCDHASGDAVILMDSDLQDPPEIVPKLIEKWHEGYEVVYAVRKERKGETAFKKLTAWAYYKLLMRLTPHEIPESSGDFRLISRPVLEAFKSMREEGRFVRGMISWIGFRQIGVPYIRDERAAGKTKYPIRKMLSLAAEGIIGFSEAPLRFSIWLGILVSVFGFLYALYSISVWIFGHTVQGWTSTIIIVSLIGGANLLMTGVLGLYIGQISREVRRRPLYVVTETIGLKTNNGKNQSNGSQ